MAMMSSWHCGMRTRTKLELEDFRRLIEGMDIITRRDLARDGGYLLGAERRRGYLAWLR